MKFYLKVEKTIREKLNNPWRNIKILIKILFFKDRYSVVLFDRENPPIEGDTITVGYITAEFKK